MKITLKFLLLATCAMIRVVSASAQWVEQQSGTPEDLTGVRFINADTGFACGAFNTLIKTTNGGESWQAVSQAQVPSSSYTALDALSTTRFFVARKGLYATEDGGNTWNEWGALSSYAGSVLAMKALNDSTAFVMKDGNILKTANKGADWTVIYSANHLAGPMQFTGNNDTAYAAAGISYDGISMGTLHKSVDGGHTWTDLGMSSPQITAMHFISPLAGWYVDFENHLFRTTDGALTWTAVGSPVPPDSDYITAVHFLNTTTGYAATYRGFIYGTQNGGASWTVEHTGHQTGGNYDRPISALTSLGGAHLLSVGNAGAILKSGAPTGILQAVKDPVHVYPNPTSGTFIVEPGSMDHYTRLVMYDLAGRICYAQDISGLRQVRLNVAQFGSGQYILELLGTEKGTSYRQRIAVR